MARDDQHTDRIYLYREPELLARFDEATPRSKRSKNGTVKYREEVFEGLESLPAAFCGLFTGASFGRRVVRV